MKVRANDVLKETGERNAGSAGRARARTALTVAEVALAVILMIGAGPLMRSFVGLRGVDVGFDPRQLVTAPALVMGIVLAVSSVSARGATRVEPSDALRGE